MCCWKYPRWRHASGISYCASERKLFMLGKHQRLAGAHVGAPCLCVAVVCRGRDCSGALANAKSLQLLAPGFVDLDERLPTHCLAIMQFVLAINAAGVRPLVIDAATGVVFIQVPADTVAAVHRGGISQQMYASTAFHAAAAGKGQGRVRHTHPSRPGTGPGVRGPR